MAKKKPKPVAGEDMSSQPRKTNARVTMSIRFDDEELHRAFLVYKQANRQTMTAAAMSLLEKALKAEKYLPLPREGESNVK